MKTHMLIALAALVAVVTQKITRAQVEIPIESITIQQPVTTTQNVTVTAVPVTTIRFDLVSQRIDFTVGTSQGGNRTLSLTGSEYQAIRANFLDPFATAVAPALRAKLSE